MKEIKLGKINDAVTYGSIYSQFPGVFDIEPCGKNNADVKIYSDGGLIPGIAQQELEQYICNRARNEMYGDQTKALFK